MDGTELPIYLRSNNNTTDIYACSPQHNKEEKGMNFDVTLLIILGLGILLGLIIGNKAYRRSFFVGLRKFLVQLSSGARAYSAQQRKDRGRGVQHRKGQPHPNEVRHRYTQDHRLVKCPRCEGTGRIPRKMPKMLDGRLLGKQTFECPDCEGTGKVYD